jgi:signal transduction histidine kinase
VTDPVLVEWTRFAGGESLEGNVRVVISDSWGRSKAAGVSHDSWSCRRLSDDDLRRRINAHTDMIALATSYLDWLETLLSTTTSSACMAGMVDRDGILLCGAGALKGLLGSMFQPGNDLSEPSVGTFAAGLALVAKEPVAVCGTEHYCLNAHGFFSYGAPIDDEMGRAIGALFAVTMERLGPESLGVVGHLAHDITGELIQRRNAESVRLLARMSSFIAHELGNPLTVLKGNLSMLSRRVSDERTLELVGRCEKITDQMTDLVKELRALGGARMDLKQMSVKELIEGIVAATPVTPGVCLEAKSDPSLNVYANPSLLTLAIDNLVRNALDAMPEGGKVSISAKRTPNGVRVSVRDNGPGIPVGMRAGLFHSAVTTKERGSGMGLLLVRSIVENAHGGRVSYAPNRPHGSVFHIDLAETVSEQGA